MSGRRILSVKVVAGKGLFKSDACDNFAQLSLFDITKNLIKAEGDRKTLVKRGVNPEWGDTFYFGESYDLTNMDNMPTLVIQLFEEQSWQSNTPLGICKLPLEESLGIDPEAGAAEEGGAGLPPATGEPVEFTLRVEGKKLAKANTYAKLDSCSTASGEVVVELTWTEESSGSTTGPNEGEFRLPSEAMDEEQEPNCLLVRLVSATGLRAADTGLLESGLSDPRVVFRVGDVSKTSKTIQKTLTPVWNEEFEIALAKDPDGHVSSLLLTVEDVDMVTTTFLGKCQLDLEDHDDRAFVLRKDVALRDKNGQVDPKSRGTITYCVQWIYNSKFKTAKKKGGGVFSLFKREETLEEPDDAPDPMDVPKMSEAEKKAAEEEETNRKKEMEAELSGVKIESGDYQVQVHIIECRELVAKDLSGTSDPVCYVKVFDQNECTAVKEQTLNCVFDELFIISKRNVDKEDFEDTTLKIEVMDADSTSRNDLIGSYTVDLSWIYFRPKHELYRCWVGLINEEDPGDNPGIQGYLKVSVQVVGPNDKLVIHDEAKDIAAEKSDEAAAGGMSGTVIMPPALKREVMWLRTTVWRAEYLPIIDSGFITAGGIDAFFSLDFGTMAATKVKTVSGTRDELNPHFNYQLWIPVSLPTSTRVLRLSLKDYDGVPSIGVGTSKVVATSFFKWGELMDAHVAENKQLTEYAEQVQAGELPEDAPAPDPIEDVPFWQPLYGAPVGVPFKDQIYAGARRGVLGINYVDYYNSHPHNATTYRGRVLLSHKLIPQNLAPDREEVAAKRPFKVHVKETKLQMPPKKTMVLSAIVFQGVELPMDTYMGSYKPMSITVSTGAISRTTQELVPNEGTVEWFELLSTEGDDRCKLPIDPAQNADVFLHLNRGGSPIAFIRLDVQELLAKGFVETPTADWVCLAEDKAIDGLNDGTFPGTLQVCVGLGDEDAWAAVANQWGERADGRRKVSYQLRAHIFQARELPDADMFGGGIDPFFVVHFAGKTFTTKHVVHNNDPLVYSTITIDGVTTQDVVELVPQVNVQVWDYDNAMSSDYVAQFFHRFTEDEVLNPDEHPESLRGYPSPTWRPLFREEMGDSGGAVLASFQLVRTSPGQTLPPPPSIQPIYRPAAVEIMCIGIRDMAPFNFLPIQLPSMHFSVDGISSVVSVDKETGEQSTSLTPYTYSQSTDVSKKPAPSNANFLERIVLDVELPVNPIFAPSLRIKVTDTRLGGLLTPEVGKTAIALCDLCPWSQTYKPRNNDMLDVEANAHAEEDEAEMAELQKQEAARRAGVAIGGALGDEGAEEVKGEGEDEHEEEEEEKETGPEALETDDLIKLRTEEMDTGRGVFSALNHVSKEDNLLVQKKMEEMEKKKRALRRKRAKERAIQLGLVEAKPGKDGDGAGDEEDEETPKYMRGREVLTSELEASSKMLGTPFDTFELTLGSKLSSALIEADYRVVGFFKGMVRVLLNKDEQSLFKLDEVLKPQPVKVRVYVLRGRSLAARDMAMFGRPGKSDPYLRVHLGKDEFNGVDEHQDDLTDVDFYKLVEFNGEIPGFSMLSLEVWDYDDFGADDIIGRTRIDLEDRWFDKRWRDMGQEQRNEDPKKAQFNFKPLEARTLYIPTNRQSQGVLECWVDIMRPGEAAQFAPFDVSLPPSLPCEVRLVIFKAREVVAMDTLENMNDLYVKCWLEGETPQSTDIHWRAKKGKGSWNYRLKFPIELGHNTPLMKFPYLHVQMWDQDVLKWNDIIAESVLDIGQHLKKAYRKRVLVEVFRTARKGAGKKDDPLAEFDSEEEEEDEEEAEAQRLVEEALKERAEARAAKEAEFQAKRAAKDQDDLGNMPEDDKTAEGRLRKPSMSVDGEALDAVATDQPVGGGGSPVEETKGADPAAPPTPQPEDEKDGAPLLNKQSGAEDAAPRSRTWLRAFRKRKEPEKPRNFDDPVEEKEPFLVVCLQYLCCLCMPCRGTLDWCPVAMCFPCLPCCWAKEGADADAAPGEPLDEQTQEIIDKIREVLGLGESKPLDTTWLVMDKLDHATGKREMRGKLCIQLQIIPQTVADTLPAGQGRAEPNMNPYLPPPTGRLKFSLNPFVMGSQLCGPKLCAQLTCCIICIAFVLLMIFCQPALNIFVIILQYTVLSR